MLQQMPSFFVGFKSLESIFIAVHAHSSYNNFIIITNFDLEISNMKPDLRSEFSFQSYKLHYIKHSNENAFSSQNIAVLN